MIELVRILEGRDDALRRLIIMNELNQARLRFQLQEYSYAGQEGSNIIVDLKEGDPKILLVAHYDAFGTSPGANDDASSVAILLEVAQRLRKTKISRGVRLIFFDDEEPTPYWRRPIGSSVYVSDIGIEDVFAVIDLELCGIGDAVAVWPVEGMGGSLLLQETRGYLTERGVSFREGLRIPGFYADYQPFREAGLVDALCLTAFPWQERDRLFAFAEAGSLNLRFRYLAWRFLDWKLVPTIFRHYHSHLDRSEFLSEDTMRMMADIVYDLVLRIDARRAV